MQRGDTVQLNDLFEQYKYKDTWRDRDGIYDEKAYKVRQPQRLVEYIIDMIYGKEDNQWLSLRGLTGIYPAKYFEITNQFCKIRQGLYKN